MRHAICTLIAMVLLLSQKNSFAQCSANVTAENICLPAKLKVTSSTIPSRIIWKRGTTAVDTNYISWDSVGKPVLGNFTTNPLGTSAAYFFVDKNDNIYVSHQIPNGRVEKWTPGATTPIIVAGNNGSGSGLHQLNNPRGLYVDAANNLYVVDVANYRVLKFAPGATSGIKVAGGNGRGTALNQFSGPGEIFVDNAANVYVSDQYSDPNTTLHNDRVLKWAPGATTGVKVAGGNGQGNAANQLLLPGKLYVNASGTLYVSDEGNQRVQRWLSGATSGVTVATAYACSMTDVDENGIIHGFDGYGNLLRWLPGSTTGTYLMMPEVKGIDPTVFVGSSMTIGKNRQLYFTISYNSPSARILYRCSNNTDLNYVATTSNTYTASILDDKGCSITSNAFTVSSNVTPTLAITTQHSSICEGSAVTFNSSVTNAGTSPSYQWKRNAVNVGTNSSYITSDLVDGDTIRCILTNTINGCAVRDSVVMAVRPKFSASASANSNCVPASIGVKSSEIVSQIIWRKNGVNFDTTRITWQPSGNLVTKFSTNTRVTAMTMGRNDTLYVAYGVLLPGNTTFTSVRVEKYAPGSTTGTIVAYGTSGYWGIRDIFVDKSSNVYIADNRTKIVKWKPGAVAGETLITGSAGAQIEGVFVDHQGYLYYSNANVHAVYKWSPGMDSYEVIAGGSGVGSGANQLNSPQKLFVDAMGNIYVSDNGNHRVQKFAPGSLNAMTVAGGNGMGDAANQLSYPTNIFVDPSENVYVGSGSIKRFSKGESFGEVVLARTGASYFAISSKAVLYAGDFQGYSFNSIQKFEAKQNLTNDVISGGNYTTIVQGFSWSCPAVTDAFVLNNQVASSISLSQEGECAGTPISFVANLVNGINPSYQWKLNGLLTGTNSNLLTSNQFNNNDKITCIVQNGNGCFKTDSIIAAIKPLPAFTFTSTTGLPSTIKLQSDMILPEISWQYNGAALDTTHNWKTTAVVAVKDAGGIFGMAVDRQGTVYTASGSGIVKWTDSITGTRLMPQVSGAVGVALDKQEHVYGLFSLSGSPSSIVTKHDRNTGINTDIIRSEVAGNGAHQLSSPYGVVVDDSGYVYISDAGNYRVQKWKPGNATATTVASGNGSSGAYPWGVQVDAQRNVYTQLHAPQQAGIGKWTLGSTVGILVADKAPYGGNAQFYVNPRGHIFLAPNGSNVEYYKPGNVSSRTIISTSGQTIGTFVDSVGNLYTYKNYTSDTKVWKYGLDSNHLKQVNDYGVYKINATAYNGCSITDSLRVIAGSYTFNGSNSNWSDPANWVNNTPPPTVITAGYVVYINPSGSECVFTGNLTVKKGATLQVAAGKIFRVVGNLVMEE